MMSKEMKILLVIWGILFAAIVVFAWCFANVAFTLVAFVAFCIVCVRLTAYL